MRLPIFAIVVAALSACGSNPLLTPQPIRSDGVPKAKTSVLMAIDQQDPEANMSLVVGVDGRDVDCSLNFGCPVWVRVPEGKHTFRIKYRANFHGFGGESFAELDVVVDDMRAAHVYAVRYVRDYSARTVAARVVDLGERPQACVSMPFRQPPKWTECATF